MMGGGGGREEDEEDPVAASGIWMESNGGEGEGLAIVTGEAKEDEDE